MTVQPPEDPDTASGAPPPWPRGPLAVDLLVLTLALEAAVQLIGKVYALVRSDPA